jgi:DnaK suppressor protein
MSKFNAAAVALTARLDNLENRLQDNVSALCIVGDADLPERTIIDATNEPLEALNDASLAEIAEIKLALARIHSGTYGICLICGEAIHVGRLTALPTAAQCIACAEEDERLYHRL